MIQLTPQMRILVAVEPADFRKGIDGLGGVCRRVLREDPFSGCVFVFRNRRATAIKILARFCKVRHYGLHHSSKRQTIRLLQAAMALESKQPLPLPSEDEDRPVAPACPHCNAPMVFAKRLSTDQWLMRFAKQPPTERSPP